MISLINHDSRARSRREVVVIYPDLCFIGGFNPLKSVLVIWDHHPVFMDITRTWHHQPVMTYDASQTWRRLDTVPFFFVNILCFAQFAWLFHHVFPDFLHLKNDALSIFHHSWIFRTSACFQYSWMFHHFPSFSIIWVTLHGPLRTP